MASPLVFSSIFSMNTTIGMNMLSIGAASVNQVAKEFFTHVFLHPTAHLPLLIIFSAVALGSVLGPLYLIKKTYDAHVKGTTLSQELDFILKYLR